MSRHFLCPFQERLHDMSHHMYKALEGKVKDLSFNEWERAWALRLAHGLSFFGGIDHRHAPYMRSIAETHFTPILFHSDQDLWNILPCNSPLASQFQNHCRSHINTNQNFLHVLQTLTRAIFDSVSTGKLWRGCLGLVPDASPAYFPDILLFDNDFIMSRLHQNCPFIFRVINHMLNILKPPPLFPSLAAPTTLAFFY